MALLVQQTCIIFGFTALLLGGVFRYVDIFNQKLGMIDRTH